MGSLFSYIMPTADVEKLFVEVGQFAENDQYLEAWALFFYIMKKATESKVETKTLTEEEEEYVLFLTELSEIFTMRNNRLLLNYAKNFLGRSLNLTKRYIEAIDCFSENLWLSEETKNRDLRGRAYIGIGYAQRYLGNQDKAIESYEKAIENAKDIEDSQRHATALAGIGLTYMMSGKLDSAVVNFELALEIVPPTRLGSRASILNDLGYAYICKEQYDKAITCLLSGKELSKGVDDITLQPNIFTNLGHAYFKVGKVTEGIAYLETAIDTANKTGDTESRQRASALLDRLQRFVKSTSFEVTDDSETSSPTIKIYGGTNFIGDIAKMDLQGNAVGEVKRLIEFDRSEKLGTGRFGKVYGGTFDQRKVAVKRIQLEDLAADSSSKREREVEVLRQLSHENVVKYYFSEETEDFLHIAIELCNCTVEKFVKEKRYDNLLPIDVATQTTRGISYLHSMEIVHGDIKPSNILITEGNMIKITDFGLSRKLAEGRQSFTVTSGVGTHLWTAPELFKSCPRATKSCDMFSLGILIHHLLSEGLHPYGEEETLTNMVGGKMDLNRLKYNINEAKHILPQLLCLDPKMRPEASLALHYPLFWKSQKQLSFLQDVSSRIQKEDIASPLVVTLESNAEKIFNKDWKSLLCPLVQSEIENSPSMYDSTKVTHLLHLIKTKNQHFNDQPETIQKAIGAVPTEFIQYFTDRFPCLLISCYEVIQRVCKEEDAFAQYY